MRIVSIKERLILYFVVLSVISIAIISLFSIFEAKKGITNRTFSQLIILRDLRKEQIYSFFQTRNEELQSLSHAEKIVKLADVIQNSGRRINLSSYLQEDMYLLERASNQAFHKTLYFLSKTGVLINLTSAASGIESVVNLKNSFSDTSFFSSLRLNSSGREPLVFEQMKPDRSIRIFMAVPVVSEHEQFKGALLSEILPGAINRIIYKSNPGSGMGKTGEAYLVGTDGLMRSPSRFVPQAELTVSVNTEGFFRAIDGEEGVGIYEDYRGIKILGAYGGLNIGGMRWIILAEIDSEEAMVPLAAIRNEIMLLSLVIVFSIFTVAWLVAHGLTRPLVRLKSAANFIARGNYDQELEISGNDEIGELTQAFNAMALEIKSTTHELKENEERLRHFYRATLDGIILHENEQMILVNSAMLSLTGYSEEEFLRLRISEILQAGKSQECFKDSEPRTFEALLVRKDDPLLVVEVQESCMEFDGKNIRASVVRDISARKNMEAELSEERYKRLRAVFDGQDQERQRLSRELHDGLGQQLAAGKLILESSLYTENLDGLKTKISEAQRIFDQIIGDIRRISHNLSPSALQEFGLKSAMENLCNNFRKTTGIQVNFMAELNGRFPGDMTSTYLFRIAQEGLNNVQRHSGAKSVKLVLKIEQNDIVLTIEDNGHGFNPKEIVKKGGNGLFNMRERVSIMKGNIKIKSHPEKGTIIFVRVPL